jgi:hypothetical protein
MAAINTTYFNINENCPSYPCIYYTDFIWFSEHIVIISLHCIRRTFILIDEQSVIESYKINV